MFNTPGANANAVAELVMTVLGMAVRNVDKAAAWVKGLDVNDPDLAKTVESGKKKFAGMELAGKTLGVIGLGKIGVLVANYARWKNMRVLAYEPYPNAANMHELSNKVETATLEEVIAKSDFLTVHVPFIKGVTENLLNRKNLAGFKGSYIMNFARGGIVEMAPVNEMLASGSLQGYLCDFPDAINIDDDGNIDIAAPSGKAAAVCRRMIEELTAEPEPGRKYKGKVKLSMKALLPPKAAPAAEAPAADASTGSATAAPEAPAAEAAPEAPAEA